MPGTTEANSQRSGRVQARVAGSPGSGKNPGVIFAARLLLVRAYSFVQLMKAGAGSRTPARGYVQKGLSAVEGRVWSQYDLENLRES